MKKFNKILYIVCILIIIVGAIVAKTLGVNYSRRICKRKKYRNIF